MRYKMTRRINCRTIAFTSFAIYLIWATFPRQSPPPMDMMNYDNFIKLRNPRFRRWQHHDDFGDDSRKEVVVIAEDDNAAAVTAAESDYYNSNNNEPSPLFHTTTVTPETTISSTTILIVNHNEPTTTHATTQSPSVVTSRIASKKLVVGKEILPFCPDPPPNLHGQLNVSFDGSLVVQTANDSIEYQALKNGGIFRPQSCTSRYGRVAIIVPYRSREAHLQALLNHLHPILQRQLLNYAFIVVEQAGTGTFNKAILMNIGFKESKQLVDPSDLETEFQCYVFHDVDLFAEDDRGSYACRDVPFHLSEFLDKLKYKPYPHRDILFGGVVQVPRRHFELVNGYSNIFFGWGGEDDEMRVRFQHRKIPVQKATDKERYRYKMFSHDRDQGNSINSKRRQLIADTGQRMFYDGLSSLTYKLLARNDRPTYTHFLVEINQTEVMNRVFAASSQAVK